MHAYLFNLNDITACQMILQILSPRTQKGRCAAMGRAKGSVELILEKDQIDEVLTYIKGSIPETVKGAMGAAPGLTFNEYATKSPSAFNGHGLGRFIETLLETLVCVLYGLCCQQFLFNFLVL